MKFNKSSMLVATLGFLIPGLYVLRAVLSSHSSTAAVGLIWIPIYGVIGSVTALAAVYLFRHGWIARIGLVLAALLVFIGHNKKSQLMDLARNPLTPASELQNIETSWLLWGREDVLVELAQNPSLPKESMRSLLKQSSSLVLLNLASNTSVDEEILNAIRKDEPRYDVDSRVAANPNITRPLIDKMLAVTPANFKSVDEYKLYQTYALAALARNPKITNEDFQKLSNWPQPEYFLVYALIDSGRSSCEQLEKFKTGVYDVLRGNAMTQLQKQNCPH